MKIGVLTFHRALNYGAVLQCYALKETLIELGHDVEIIDYRPLYVEKYRNLFSGNNFQKFGLLKQLLYLCKLPYIYIFKRKASKTFDDFLKVRFTLSNRVSGINEIPSYYDVIIFGSDQIWSPHICKGFDSVFWGQFEKNGRCFISYAASFPS